MNPNTTIRYQFQRGQILKRDVSSFVETFDLRKMPKVALRSYCGGLQLEIEAASGERRQPYLVPEVRSFCRKLEGTWPHVTFCCELRTAFVFIHTLSQLDYLAAMERDNAPRVFVQFKWPELEAVITRGLAQIQKTGRRARMSKSEIMERRTQYIEYFIDRLGCKSPG